MDYFCVPILTYSGMLWTIFIANLGCNCYIEGWEQKSSKWFFTYIYLALFRSHPSIYISENCHNYIKTTTNKWQCHLLKLKNKNCQNKKNNCPTLLISWRSNVSIFIFMLQFCWNNILSTESEKGLSASLLI